MGAKTKHHLNLYILLSPIRNIAEATTIFFPLRAYYMHPNEGKRFEFLAFGFM
jgi:hypothetical protein